MTPEHEVLAIPSVWEYDKSLVIILAVAVYLTPARIEIPSEKRTSKVLILELVG